MEHYVVLVFTLLCIYVTFSHAEEIKEKTISHIESQPNVICPDGTVCLNRRCCPTRPDRRLWACCDPRYGPSATCCNDFKTCCPPGWTCITSLKLCRRPMYSSVLQVQAIPLVNSTEKRCRDGTAGMDSKVSRVIPSQQAEQASKRSGLIGTSGNVFSPDEKYQCPDGTTICELSSGIYGYCPIENARRRP